MSPRGSHASAAALDVLFRRKPIADLAQLRTALGTTSRTSVFRALCKVGYVSSYSHAGRYYALRRIPTFDAQGLWFVGEVRFSKHGTLRATVVVLVDEAPAGHTHDELTAILGLRIQDTLRSLVEAQSIARQRVESVYVYLAADPQRAAAQLEQRRGMAPGSAPAVVALEGMTPLDAARMIDILLAVIRAPRASAKAIGAGLRARGLAVSDAQVEDVFTRHDLGKKTALSRSRRSPP